MILQVMNARLYWDPFATTKVERKYLVDMVFLCLLSISRFGTQLHVQESRPQVV